MTEILVHTLEAFIVGLILIKLVQVRSLYLRSRPTNDSSRRATNSSSKSVAIRSSATHEHTFHRVERDQLCLKDLPLPEVSFSNDHHAVINSTKQTTENLAQNLVNSAVEKCALENYIDDFFIEENRPLFSETHIENEKDDDEFITIQKENADIVRKIQLATNTAGLAS